jgi:predicted secreted protein
VERPGTAQIGLSYRRAWDTEAGAAQTFTLTVRGTA